MAEKTKINFLEIFKEIGVITFGILIAYQLNNWKDLRSTRNTEEKMLQEIKANLQLDLIDLNDNREGHSQSLILIDSIKSIAESGVYSNNIPLMIRMVLRDFIFNAQTSAFETLKAQGVNLIQNDSIRIRMLRLYDFDYRTIEKIEESYQPHQFTRHYDHIVLNYFDGFDLRIENGASPIHSGTAWLQYPDVNNRLDLVKAERQFILQQYDKSISEVNALINTIENELKNEF
jgi:hypothetical protein